MPEKLNITGGNIYSYNITPDGFTASQPNGKNLLIQKIPYMATEEEWKSETKRLEIAKEYVYNKNLMLLKEARYAAKERVRKLYELSVNEPLDIDGVLWDARKESLHELLMVQLVCMNNGMPITFNDTTNKSHTFPNPEPKAGVPIVLVPVLNKIALSLVPKIGMKNKLYADVYAMTDIDALNKFNPIDKFNLTGIESKYF